MCATEPGSECREYAAQLTGTQAGKGEPVFLLRGAWWLIQPCGPQAMGLHGGNRSQDSSSQWEMFAVMCQGQAMVGGGVITSQKLLGWESPIASSVQDSGHVVVAHPPLVPLPVLSQGPCP